jgi:dynein light chain LC8-type
MDTNWEPYWHVFLGKSFGCHAVHEKNRFVYFTFEQQKISFLIYKAS